MKNKIKEQIEIIEIELNKKNIEQKRISKSVNDFSSLLLEVKEKINEIDEKYSKTTNPTYKQKLDLYIEKQKCWMIQFHRFEELLKETENDISLLKKKLDYYKKKLAEQYISQKDYEIDWEKVQQLSLDEKRNYFEDMASQISKEPLIDSTKIELGGYEYTINKKYEKVFNICYEEARKIKIRQDVDKKQFGLDIKFNFDLYNEIGSKKYKSVYCQKILNKICAKKVKNATEVSLYNKKIEIDEKYIVPFSIASNTLSKLPEEYIDKNLIEVLNNKAKNKRSKEKRKQFSNKIKDTVQNALKKRNIPYNFKVRAKRVAVMTGFLTALVHFNIKSLHIFKPSDNQTTIASIKESDEQSINLDSMIKTPISKVSKSNQKKENENCQYISSPTKEPVVRMARVEKVEKIIEKTSQNIKEEVIEIKENIKSAPIVNENNNISMDNNYQENQTTPINYILLYNITPEQSDVIKATVQHEAGFDATEVYAVMSTVINRCRSGRWGGNNPYDVITAPGQYESYYAGYYLQYLNGNYADYTSDIVDAMLTGEKQPLHGFESFSGGSYARGIQFTKSGNRYR